MKQQLGIELNQIITVHGGVTIDAMVKAIVQSVSQKMRMILMN